MDNVIKVLRYVFTIPVALILTVIGSMFIPYLFVLYIPINSIMYSIVFFTIQSLCIALIPLAVVYYMPPKHHTKIITVLGCIYILFWVFSLIISIFIKSFTWNSLANAVIQSIGIVCYLASINEKSKIKDIKIENIEKEKIDEVI